MAEEPKARIWLRRYRSAVGLWRVQLYDAATGSYFGEPLDYPRDFDAALQQLNMLRSRHGDALGKNVFCDGLGDHWK